MWTSCVSACASYTASGVDLFKVMSTGGGMTDGSNVCAAQYSVEELTMLVQEARAPPEDRRRPWTRYRRDHRGGRGRRQRGRALHLGGAGSQRSGRPRRAGGRADGRTRHLHGPDAERRDAHPQRRPGDVDARQLRGQAARSLHPRSPPPLARAGCRDRRRDPRWRRADAFDSTPNELRNYHEFLGRVASPMPTRRHLQRRPARRPWKPIWAACSRAPGRLSGGRRATPWRT